MPVDGAWWQVSLFMFDINNEDSKYNETGARHTPTADYDWLHLSAGARAFWNAGVRLSAMLFKIHLSILIP